MSPNYSRFGTCNCSAGTAIFCRSGSGGDRGWAAAIRGADMVVVKKMDARAAKARGRMARRAKRDRWFKENKKRILMIFLGFLLIAFLAFFTPWGPDYYYNKLQEKKMSAPDTVAAGYIEGLYKLGVFYNFTMRENDAMRCYNELSTLYYGFSIYDYATNPETALDKRDDAEARKKKNLSNGPPFRVPDSDLKYIGYSIWRVGEIIQKAQSRQFTLRIWKDLYLDEFKEQHPIQCDPKVTEIVKNYVDRMLGNR